MRERGHVKHGYLDHLHDIAAKGESDSTPVVLIAAVVIFVAPLVALVVLLADGAAHLA